MDIERRAQLHHALGEPHRLAMVDALLLSDRAPSELARLTGLGTNLVAFHLDVLEDAGLLERRVSQGDGRRRYVHLRASALTGLGAPPRLRAADVLFVCTANSARSQLAAALWERRTGRVATSAGAAPAGRVHPLAIEVAAAHGLPLGDPQPRGYDEVTREPDLVVAVCDLARESGPPFGAPLLHWSVPDPVGGDRAAFEAAFSELERRVDHLAAQVVAA